MKELNRQEMIQNDRPETICNPSNLLYEVTRRCNGGHRETKRELGRKPPRFAGAHAAKAPSIPDNWIGHGLDEDWTRMPGEFCFIRDP